MTRHEFLRLLHTIVRPRTYVETGIQKGQSLTLSRVPSIGIDPAFQITSELLADVQLAKTTSDEFFARKHPVSHLPHPVVDLAFIDGMHLSEYALRDYLAIERFTTPASVLVFDDMLPRSIDEAARNRHTRAWTGDVYKVSQALKDLCPGLIVLEVDTAPTGVAVVLNPDASRDGVLAGYDDWLDVATAPDPQQVPESVMRRTNAHDPHRLLASAGWQRLPALRTRKKISPDAIRAAFADVVAA